MKSDDSFNNQQNENPPEDRSKNSHEFLSRGEHDEEFNYSNSDEKQIKPDFPIEDLRFSDVGKTDSISPNITKPPVIPDLITDTSPYNLLDGNTNQGSTVASNSTVNPKRHAPPYATQPFATQPFNTSQTKATSNIPSEPLLSTKISSQPVTTKTKTSEPYKTVKNMPVKKKPTDKSTGCFFKALVGILLLGFIGIIIIGSAAIFQYFSLSSTLPSITNLTEKASQFETVRIMDRNGDLLYEMISPTAGRRTFVPLDKISPYLIAATIATEDKDYYNHPGYDPFALMRALVQNYTAGEIVSGASTITQQLARMLLFSQEERGEQSLRRKGREIVLAAEITRKYSKEQILELYLNEVYYGNLAYGIEAAAETYFNTAADKLTLSQASFLAGLPQAPGVYDIFTNREETLNRHIRVLDLMVQDSEERNCIYISTNIQPVCIDPNSAAAAAVEISDYPFEVRQNNMRFPHWVNFIRTQLEKLYEPQTIFKSGFTVYTTIDPTLQEIAERIVKDQIATLADRKVTDGALIAIQPSSGQILSMVGSADFNNVEISGQVNMAVSPRQPGSSIKPITYTAAFEKGWTPATLIWDVPSEFPPSGDPNDPREPYKPINYDEKFHGPVTVRSALANSYNVPAVKTLDFVGIYDDPNTKEEEGFISFAKRMGITSLTRPDYGLALTLGGGEVTLLDLTSAFAVFANKGAKVQPISILRIVDFSGTEVFQYKPEEPVQIIRPEHAYLISSILSDNEARTPMFGENSILRMPFDAAAKTGTTNDFRDNWTMGYSPDLAVGVWVGNADYSPMQNTTGLTGAAPIWSTFMSEADPLVTGNNPTSFTRPGGIEERVICSFSGTEASDGCPNTRTEIFASDQLPLPKSKDFYTKITIDTWTGLLASGVCEEFQKSINAITVNDEWGRKWLRETDQGKAWLEKAELGEGVRFAPENSCSANDPKPTLYFPGLEDNQSITESPFDIYVVAEVPSGFKSLRLDYGLGEDPKKWIKLAGPFDSLFQAPERLVTWDVSKLAGERVTLRLVMTGNDDNYAEKRIRLNLDVPEPTATPVPTETATPTESPTFTPTIEILPTDTATTEPTIELSTVEAP